MFYRVQLQLMRKNLSREECEEQLNAARDVLEAEKVKNDKDEVDRKKRGAVRITTELPLVIADTTS